MILSLLPDAAVRAPARRPAEPAADFTFEFGSERFALAGRLPDDPVAAWLGAQPPGRAVDDDDARWRLVLAVFARTGGIAGSDELARRARDDDASLLHELIRTRRVVSSVRDGRRLLPLFQFAGTGLSPRRGVAGALAELADVYDDAEIATWFGTANAWLGGLAPAELAACAPHEVVQAARADRFVARG